jgi:predicted kinase
MQDFKTFYEAFKSSKYADDMRSTFENSPWHREESVWRHTEMCLEAYNSKFASDRSAVHNRIAQFALLFHDIGKPKAQEVLEKKDMPGEFYRRYAGHEQDSATAFTECYTTMPELRALLNPLEARAVRWVIEHHLPYAYKDKRKRAGLATSTFRTLYAAVGQYSYEIFFDCLRSDAAGRISDDHEKKLLNVEEWITEFKTIPIAIAPTNENFTSTMYILVGPSGSGKSTWVNKTLTSPSVISLDTFRLELFAAKHTLEIAELNNPESYAAAWEYANKNAKEFSEYVVIRTKDILSMTPPGSDVVIDNTNLGRKRRAIWIDQARRRKMKIVGVEFWNSSKTLLERQGTRSDKSVPGSSVLSQLYSAQNCWLEHEVHEVQLVID